MALGLPTHDPSAQPPSEVAMLSFSLAAALVLPLQPPDPAKLPAPTGDAVVPPGARLELLFTRTAKISGGLTEGPAAAPDGSIYFSDIPLGKDRGMILHFDPKTKKTRVFVADSRKYNGLEFDMKGGRESTRL